MEVHSNMFVDIALIFLAAALGGLLAWRLNLPLILGFIIGGIAISPFTPGPKLKDVDVYYHAAEVGVVLLMFSIGAEFSVPDLMRVKWFAIGGCVLGVGGSIGLATLIGWLHGWTITHGIVIGATISVASTMVLARLMTDSGGLTKSYGRSMIGVTLMEDLAVVMMTVVLPSFSGTDEGQFTKAAWILGKAVIMLIPLTFLALKVIPRILRWAQKTKSSELFYLVALAICIGTAALAEAIGFSVAMGAFLAGLAISGSADLHEAHDLLMPLRDAFVALFFVSLGALIEPEVILEHWRLLGLMLALIIPGKFLLYGTVALMFRNSLRDSVIIAAGLTQIGELSFVIVQTAVASGLVSNEVFNATLAASLVSIFINVFVVRAVLAWAEGKKIPQPVSA